MRIISLHTEPSKYRGRRRLSSAEGANTVMMMSMVPSPVAALPSSPNEPDVGDRPALSIAKQFRRQVEEKRRMSVIQTRAMSLEGVPKIKTEQNLAGKKKSGERPSLKDRREIKSSRSSKSLSAGVAARPGPGKDAPLVNVEALPTPPPPTPRSPVPPIKITTESEDAKPTSTPPPQKVTVAPPVPPSSPPSSGREEPSRNSGGTSVPKKFTFFMPKKTQTDDTNKGRVSSSVRKHEFYGYCCYFIISSATTRCFLSGKTWGGFGYQVRKAGEGTKESES